MAKKILVVDDDPGSVSLFESMLKDRGYLVSTAYDGEEAITKAKAAPPDLIILDILMPKIDGTEVAMVLKQSDATKNIPIYFITALIAPEDKVDPVGAGSTVFPKPVNMSAMIEKIKKEIG